MQPTLVKPAEKPSENPLLSTATKGGRIGTAVVVGLGAGAGTYLLAGWGSQQVVKNAVTNSVDKTAAGLVKAGSDSLYMLGAAKAIGGVALVAISAGWVKSALGRWFGYGIGFGLTLSGVNDISSAYCLQNPTPGTPCACSYGLGAASAIAAGTA